MAIQGGSLESTGYRGYSVSDAWYRVLARRYRVHWGLDGSLPSLFSSFRPRIFASYLSLRALY